MQHQPVTSSLIESIAHDPETNELEVKFRAGKTYVYKDVTADDHAALMGAKSIGSHFGQHIRGKYVHALLDDMTESER